MGTPDVDAVLRNPGRFSVGPTDLSTAWPHGGTGLGVVAETTAVPVYKYEAVIAEEFAGEEIKIIEMGGSWIVGATLREYGDDSISAFFNSTTGASGSEIVEAPTNTYPGTTITAVVLLFTPYEQTTHPALLAFEAIPMVTEAATLALELQSEMVLPVMYRCLRNASNKQIQIGLLSDLTL